MQHEIEHIHKNTGEYKNIQKHMKNSLKIYKIY